MAFLSGSISFERFQVSGSRPTGCGMEQLEILTASCGGSREPSTSDLVQVSFTGGAHLLDQTFDLEKNLIDDALHFGVRVDTNQIPSVIRKAWLQLELAGIMAEHPDRRPTKAERQEAKDAVEARCAQEIAAGKYHRMAHFPVLWDGRSNMVYFGGSNGTACGHFTDLMHKAFEVELTPVGVGRLARNWAERTGQFELLDQLTPAAFHPSCSGGEPAWTNKESQLPDFLGNEFLLWLWHRVETEGDTIRLHDESEVTVMFAKSLVLECPSGESGKETMVSEIPTKLPEALEGIRTGKLPRKAGLVLVRFGQQYELTLQAETFAISGARLQADREAVGREVVESRIDAIRNLNETVDTLFETFCSLRIAEPWGEQLERIRRWVHPRNSPNKRSAA